MASALAPGEVRWTTFNAGLMHGIAVVDVGCSLVPAGQGRLSQANRAHRERTFDLVSTFQERYMKQWIGPAVLCIGLTIAASASGQEVLPTPTPIIVGPAVHCYDCTQEKNGFIHRCIDKFERHGCGYGTTHQDIGTIGVRAHCVFIFGNSQQFFGEPCNKQPQHRWFRKY